MVVSFFGFVLIKTIDAASPSYQKDENKYVYYSDQGAECKDGKVVKIGTDKVRPGGDCAGSDDEGNPIVCTTVPDELSDKNVVGCFIKKETSERGAPPPSRKNIPAPVTKVEDNCPLTKEEYNQCGGTEGLEDLAKTNTYHIVRSVDCKGEVKKYEKPQDLGDLGQCGTIQYRVASSYPALQQAQWQPYQTGGVTISVPSDLYSIDPTLSKQSIFVQFLDNNSQIIKFENGDDFTFITVDFEKDKPTENLAVTLETSPTVGGINRIWEPASVKVTISGLTETGNSLAAVFVRQQAGECSVESCGFLGWTRIKGYATNGTDQFSWTPNPGDLTEGTHMFGVFSLNPDGTGKKLLGVSATNFTSR